MADHEGGDAAGRIPDVNEQARAMLDTVVKAIGDASTKEGSKLFPNGIELIYLKLEAGLSEKTKITAVINESWQATGASEEQAVAAASKAIEEQAATIPLVTRPAIFAFRSDRIKAEFVAADGNIDPLHNVADFTRVKSS